MPVFEVEDDSECPICGEIVEINCRPDVKPGLGVCNECGLPHFFEPAEPREGEVLSEVNESLSPDIIDWEVIEAYYEATGNRAVTIICCEVTEEEKESFDEWANEEFDMYWGMSVEEAKENGWNGA